jgi:tetratricopeptide (TPR) repeat protein
MTEYSDDYCEQEFNLQVEKFNQMIRSGNIGYFDVSELEQLTDHFLENFDSENAARAAELALSLHPTSLSAKFMAARGLAAKGKLKPALKLIDELESVEYSNEEIYLLKGSIQSELKLHKQSEESFRRAIALSPDRNDEILVDIAFQQVHQQEYHGAIDSLKSALSVNPDNEIALHELSYCYECTKAQEEMIQFYIEFIDQNPYSYAAWYNLGNTYFKRQEYSLAVDAFDFCLAIDSQFTPAHFNRANALIQLEQYKEAIYSFDCMMNKTGQDAHLLCYIGECYEKMDEFDLAAATYNAALEEDEHCAEALIGLAVLCGLKNESAQSVAYYEQALTIEDEVDTYWYLYALAAKETGELDKAEMALAKCIDMDTDDPDIWEAYAELKALKGEYDEAVDILYVAYYRLGYDAHLIFRMAFYKSLGDSQQEAQDLLYLALQQNPDGITELLTYCPEAQNDPFIMGFATSGNI